MGVAREKPWTVEDLAEWLGYGENTGRALEVVRDHGVPYFFLGPPGKKFGDPGAWRYLRFVPAKVEAWAAARSVEVEPVGDAPAPAPAPAARPGQGGWKSGAAKPKLRGPRAGA